MRRPAVVMFIVTIGCAPERHDWPLDCPNPGRDDVAYRHASWADRDVCAVIDFACTPPGVPLHDAFPNFSDNDCGCGCFGEPHDLDSEGTTQPAGM